MKQQRWVIIGAGPTGLGAAYRLKELGIEQVTILDAAPEAGGLSRSFVDDQGFTWDIGGHVQFSHYAYFDELMKRALGEDGWFQHQREAWARMFGTWVPYPVQNNLRHLPKEALAKCVSGLVRLYKQGPSATPPKNFSEWIDATLGEGLAEVFMRPYNFKVWAYPPNELAWSWIGERVAVADLERVLNNVIFEKDDVSWGPNNTFGFPKRGGTGAIWKAVADLIGARHFKFGASVASVDPVRKQVLTVQGDEVPYDVLVSTMPVDQLAGRVTGLDAEAVAAAQKLVHSSTNIVGLGLAGATPTELKTKCWVYFPEASSPFYRATVFSNYSPAHVPDPKRFWSLMTETSESPKKVVDHETLIQETIDGAIATGLIRSRDEVVSVWRHRVEYGYPTPTVDRDASLSRVLPALEKFSIFSRGRFGAWKYEVANQDHSLMQGVEVVNRVVLGVPETTLPFPNTANANWGKR
jgi:protoporphyrinogen oxidase